MNRYVITLSPEKAEIKEYPNGDWVKWDDYIAALAAVTAQRDALAVDQSKTQQLARLFTFEQLLDHLEWSETQKCIHASQCVARLQRDLRAAEQQRDMAREALREVADAIRGGQTCYFPIERAMEILDAALSAPENK